VIILIILARKGPVLITLLVFIIYFFKVNGKRKYVISFIVVVVALILMASKIDEIRNRFIELLNVIIYNDRNNSGSTSIRLIIYNCSIEAITSNPFFGYGLGDVKDILNQCYTGKGISYYNSHNQFLSAWLSAGLLGIGSLVYMFVYNFNKALKSKEIVYISIMSLFLVLGIFENILERQDGVILFSFFVNFFAFKNSKTKL
jgi:O-antigen ligase